MMARNFKQSKIYAIVSKNSNKIYIGNTTQDLDKRFKTHLKQFNGFFNGKSLLYYSSFKILKLKNPRIVLLEDCQNVNNDFQLRKREQYYINLYKDRVVNVARPFSIIKSLI